MTPTFTSYTEAQNWIAEGMAKYGKRAFTARPEYHAAYAQIAALHAAEGNKRHRRGKNTKNLTTSLMAWSLHTA
jgi:hypothetical protein